MKAGISILNLPRWIIFSPLINLLEPGRFTDIKKLAKASLILWFCILFLVIVIYRSYRLDGSMLSFVNLIPFAHLIDLLKERIEYCFKDSSILLYPSLCRFLRPWLYNLLFYIWPGFVIPFVNKKTVSFPKLLAGCAVFSFLVNVARLLSKSGSFDIDDIILNLCGFSIGYLLYRLTIKVRDRMCISTG